MAKKTRKVLKQESSQRAIRQAMSNVQAVAAVETPASAPIVVLFFVLRLTVFAGVIYGSLKCFQGSVAALLFGLGLAVLAIGWEAIRLMRD